MLLPQATPLRSARGFSVIELLVAMVIASFLILAVVSLYSNSRTTYAHQEEQARLQENMRIGMSLIERTIRQGNYKQIPAARDQNPLLVEAFSFQQLQGHDGDGTDGDWIQVTYNGSSRFPANPLDPADGAIVDCIGQPVHGGEVRNNRFLITRDADDRPWLSCERPGLAGAARVRLIPDVEALEVAYGIYADESRTVTRFIPWSAAVEPSRVVAIRLGLLFRSSSEIAPAPTPNTYEIAGETYGPFEDRYLRLPVESTIVIRSTAM